MVARKAHNLEVTGSSPVPANVVFFQKNPIFQKYKKFWVILWMIFIIVNKFLFQQIKIFTGYSAVW